MPEVPCQHYAGKGLPVWQVTGSQVNQLLLPPEAGQLWECSLWASEHATELSLQSGFEDQSNES